MVEFFKEFLGIGGFKRPAEGYMSWQHLLYASLMMCIMIALAVWLGVANRNKPEKQKNKVLIWTAIIIDTVEIVRIIVESFVRKQPNYWLYCLPLFLCSIQFITIPLAAFAKGRLKEVGLDFVFVFGVLASIAGNFFAGHNYSAYPVLCYHNMTDALTHTISGFASLYIVISGMVSMKKKNLPIMFGIIAVASVLAYITNKLIGYNYFFLMGGDGTPYDIIYNMVNGHPVIYPVIVVLLLFVYILVYNLVYNLIAKNSKKPAKQSN